jgi:hypothetical protein
MMKCLAAVAVVVFAFAIPTARAGSIKPNVEVTFGATFVGATGVDIIAGSFEWNFGNLTTEAAFVPGTMHVTSVGFLGNIGPFAYYAKVDPGNYLDYVGFFDAFGDEIDFQPDVNIYGTDSHVGFDIYSCLSSECQNAYPGISGLGVFISSIEHVDNVSPTPEPNTILLFGTVILGTFFVTSRRTMASTTRHAKSASPLR